MKTFKNLKEDSRIINADGETMDVIFWDFYGTGEKIMCFASKSAIYPANEFLPEDWEELEE